ncbi:hypothetical protein [Tritonibacter mobilis]|uniref:hypothetical protein n=1 Tax=Tritonibacter mobilis TaxID=379347 RepID=UPI000F7D9B74|nr:hypothetical protein [Tritonibacter mobilis]
MATRFFSVKGKGETFCQESINWALLRGFGATRLATVTAMMPFVGYAILYNSQLSHLLGGFGGLLDQQVSAQKCGQFLSFETRLNLVYVGLFTIGVSALVFKAAAPRELKLYRDVNEFIDQERANLTARRVRSMYRTVSGRRPRVGQEILNRASWLNSDVPISKASTEFAGNKNEDVVLDLMRSFFQTQDRHYRRMAALFCFVFFIIGTLHLAVPSATFTFRVMCAIYQSY